MILFETYPKRLSQLPRATSGSNNDRIFHSSFKYEPGCPENIMSLDLLPTYNDLYHTIQLLPKWDSRTLASSLMEDSFWESRFFAFRTYPKRTSDLACWLVPQSRLGTIYPLFDRTPHYTYRLGLHRTYPRSSSTVWHTVLACTR